MKSKKMIECHDAGSIYECHGVHSTFYLARPFIGPPCATDRLSSAREWLQHFNKGAKS